MYKILLPNSLSCVRAFRLQVVLLLFILMYNYCQLHVLCTWTLVWTKKKKNEMCIVRLKTKVQGFFKMISALFLNSNKYNNVRKLFEDPFYFSYSSNITATSRIRGLRLEKSPWVVYRANGKIDQIMLLNSCCEQHHSYLSAFSY